MTSTARRSALVAGGGLALTLCAGGWLLDRFYSDAAFLPPDDFLQYWAAGRLSASGANPYDADELLPLQRAAGRPTDRPAVMMWNPPWTLTLAMPFGSLPPRTAQLFWLLAQVVVLVFCADRLWKHYVGDPRWLPLVWFGALVFFPTMYIAFAGQSSGWLLLGMVGLLLAQTSPQRAQGYVLAFLIPFAAIKPHLFVPIWIAFALEATRTRRNFAILAWACSSGFAAIAIPTLVNPDVWNQYFAAMNRPVDAAHAPLSGWRSPLVGYWIRQAIAPEAFWIQAIPTALACAATPLYWWMRRPHWNWSVELPRLILVGLIASPYGAWPYDQVVLLVPLAAAATHLVRVGSRFQVSTAFALLAIANGSALTMMREGEYFVWLPPVVLAWYAWVMNMKRAAPTHWRATASARISEVYA